MLNSQTALGYVEQIEAIRRTAEDGEQEVLKALRSQPDYEQNQDKDVLQAIELRREAQIAIEDADTLIRSFDFIYDEELCEPRLKPA